MTISQGENRFESRHRRKHAIISEVKVSIQYQPEEGRRFVAFLRNITERKRSEEDICKMNCELEERVLEQTSELESAFFSVTLSEAAAGEVLKNFRIVIRPLPEAFSDLTLIRQFRFNPLSIDVNYSKKSEIR